MTSGDAAVAVAVLAAITVSDGIRRLADDAIVLRRSVLGRWSVARASQIGNGIRLLSLCIPASLPLVLKPGIAGEKPGFGRLRARFAARTSRTRLQVTALQIQGIVVLLALVLGVPLAAFRGPRDFALALGVVLSLSVGQACLTAAALGRAGAPRWRSIGLAARVAWPFAAFRAAEIVQAQIAANVPRMAVVYGLLGQDAILREYRPLVYDVVRAGDHGEDAAMLVRLVGRPALEAFLEKPPASHGDAAYCPRCGAAYEMSNEECADCLTPLARSSRHETDSSHPEE